jgi:serine phosphatase RsbU (regulator of sigma subunit)
MEIKIAVVKVDKYHSGNSGDTVETIERPNGGISIILADGRINSDHNKSISTMVSHKVLYEISQGTRDSAAIRHTSNNIFEEHKGSVQANLNLISVDCQTNTILISRNNPVPVFLVADEVVDCLSSDSSPIGGELDIRPTMIELPINPGMAIIALSDGVYNAGSGNEQHLEILTALEALFEDQEPTAQEVAEHLLNRAIRLDEGRPKDDMSIIVLLVSPVTTDKIRRMNISMTLCD